MAYERRFAANAANSALLYESKSPGIEIGIGVDAVPGRLAVKSMPPAHKCEETFDELKSAPSQNNKQNNTRELCRRDEFVRNTLGPSAILGNRIGGRL